MMCGGTGDEKPADADVQGHCDAVKADVEKHLGKTFETFEAKSYKSQVSLSKYSLVPKERHVRKESNDHNRSMYYCA